MNSPLKMPPVNLPRNQGVIPGTERGHLPGDAPPRGLGVRAGRRDYCGALEGRTAFHFVTAAARERSRTSKAACGLSASRTDTPCSTSAFQKVLGLHRSWHSLPFISQRPDSLGPVG